MADASHLCDDACLDWLSMRLAAMCGKAEVAHIYGMIGMTMMMTTMLAWMMLVPREERKGSLLHVVFRGLGL